MNLIVHKNSRIDILDAVRGVAILSMVVYHGLYDVYAVFGCPVPLFRYLSVLEPPFAGAFILLAGISCRFSHNNVLRGLRVLALAVAVTIVTVLFSMFISPGEEIWFGILHFMGVAILLYALFAPAVNKIPPRPALILWLLLFAATYCLPSMGVLGIPHVFSVDLPASFFGSPCLFPIGLPDPNFFSADYFPLVPWLFLFLAGTVIGVPIRERKLPERFYTARVPFLAAAGRNTLIIYALHQPVLYAVLYLFFRVALS